MSIACKRRGLCERLVRLATRPAVLFSVQRPSPFLFSSMRASLLLSLLVAAVLCLSAAAAMRSYDGYTVLRVDQAKLDANQRHALKHVTDDKSLKIDRWADNDLMVPPTTLLKVEAYLRTHHLPYSVMMADVGAEIFRERIQKISHQQQHGLDVTKYADPNAFFTAYHPLADIVTFCEGLVTQFPSLVTQKQIGTSYGGVPIYVYIVSGKGSNKPAIYLEGGIHAREWIAHATVTYMLSALVNGYGQDTHITTLLDNLEYHIVPVLNVDGYLYTYSTDRMWRKTTKPNPGSSCIGTDPNRNWDNHWCLPGVGGSTDPCDDSFCGSAAFSEKCVAAAADYALANPNIVAFVDFHSYSQMWMTPYGYTSNLPANNDAQTAMSQQAVAALTAVNGTQYQEGPIYSTVYPAAGSSADWAYDNTTHVQFSFGVELRDTGTEGFLLDASQILPSGAETLAAVLSMGDYLMKNPHTIKASKTRGGAAAKKGIKSPLRFGNMHQFTPRSAAAAAKPKVKHAKAKAAAHKNKPRRQPAQARKQK